MNVPDKIHFRRGSGLVKAICGEEKVALNYNIVEYKEIFLEEEKRCPYCCIILLEEENRMLKSVINQLKEKCREIINISLE